MTMTKADTVGTLVADLLQAAVRTDGKGQLNISKLLRAAATAVAQAAAAEDGFPDDEERLVADLLDLSTRLREAGVDHAVGDRVALGAELMRTGEQSYADRFPDPYVCRRCGFLATGSETSNCPGCGAHPLTFQRFEPVYWLSLYRPHEVLERLAANPDLFRQAVRPLAPDHLNWTPPGTAWAAVDVLRHVRDADSVLAQRIALILDEDDPPLAFQPVFAWTNQMAGRPDSAESIMDAYVASRTNSVSRLRTIDPGSWRRTGVHEEFGRVTLLEQASYFAAHELTHLRQLELLRRALTAAD